MTGQEQPERGLSPEDARALAALRAENPNWDESEIPPGLAVEGRSRSRSTPDPAVGCDHADALLDAEREGYRRALREHGLGGYDTPGGKMHEA